MVTLERLNGANAVEADGWLKEHGVERQKCDVRPIKWSKRRNKKRIKLVFSESNSHINFRFSFSY